MEGKRQEFGGTVRSKVPEGNLDLQLICYKLTAVAQKKKKKKVLVLRILHSEDHQQLEA